MSRSYIHMPGLWVSNSSPHMTQGLTYRSLDFPCPCPQTSRNPSSSGIAGLPGPVSSMPSASASRRGHRPGHYVMIR